MAAKLSREELIELVEKIGKAQGTEQEMDAWIAVLRANLIDPEVTDYIFWPKKKMTPEEIVDKGLAYKPILL